MKLPEGPWSAINGWPGYYVSPDGRVFTEQKHKVMKPSISHYGYPVVNLYRDKTHKLKLVHRLVAEAFIPNPENLPVVNHLDGDKKNNKTENLEWVTQRDNLVHAYKTGLNEQPGRAVLQLDGEGIVQKRHRSVSDAAREVGAAPPYISRAAKTGIKAKGFFWRYSSDDALELRAQHPERVHRSGVKERAG